MRKKRDQIKSQKVSNRFRAKRMDHYQRPKVPVYIPVPDYTPQQVKVRGFGSRRLTSCEEAAKATGRTASYIDNLYRIGTIRGEMVDDKVFIYLLSLETLISKLKQGKIK